jgi:hypothetical protein
MMLADRPLSVEDSVDTTRHAAFALAEGSLLPKDADNLPKNLEAAFSELAKLTVKVSVVNSCYFICCHNDYNFHALIIILCL